LYQIRRLPFTGGTTNLRKGNAVPPPRATSFSWKNKKRYINHEGRTLRNQNIPSYLEKLQIKTHIENSSQDAITPPAIDTITIVL